MDLNQLANLGEFIGCVAVLVTDMATGVWYWLATLGVGIALLRPS